MRATIAPVHLQFEELPTWKASSAFLIFRVLGIDGASQTKLQVLLAIPKRGRNFCLDHGEDGTKRFFLREARFGIASAIIVGSWSSRRLRRAPAGEQLPSFFPTSM